MVNLQRFSTFFGYDFRSFGFHPIPKSNALAQYRDLSLGEASPFARSSDIPSRKGHAFLMSAKRFLQSSGPSMNNHNVNVAKRKDEDLESESAPQCMVPSYNTSPVAKPQFQPFDQTTADVYRYRQQHAVNLGSWFVHEQWMTPSIFECASEPKVSEANIAYGYGTPDNARAALEKHWDTFIQDSDFKYLANIGINTVRLPIGYWCVDSSFMKGTLYEWVSPVYQNCWPRILRAIDQAASAGIGVLVDLHGAPGSQNGQQHSGVSDEQTTLFSDQRNMDNTIEVLKYLTKELADINNVVGIQLLNEPVYDPALEDFCSRALDAMRFVSPQAQTLPMYLHDGFDLERFSKFVAGRKDFVVQDHHSYFVFTPSDMSEPGSQHIKDVRGPMAKSIAEVAKAVRGNLIIGEWSCALTDQSLANEKDAHATQKKFCTEQMNVYDDNTAGWAFWAYKTEDCDTNPSWCFRSAVGNMLPSNFGSMKLASTAAQESNRTASNREDEAASIPTVAEADMRNFNQQTSKMPRHRITRRLLRHHFKPFHRRSDITSAPMDSPEQRSQSLGYNDGKKTAKTFASYNNSRLGFKGQFIDDAITRAGPSVIAPGTESHYEQAFSQGLGEGEDAAGLGRKSV